MSQDGDAPVAVKPVRFAITPPKYSGEKGSDPQSHLESFVIASNANGWTEGMKLIQFPSSFTGFALSWYVVTSAARNRGGEPGWSWDELVDAFISQATYGASQADDEFLLMERYQKDTESCIQYLMVMEQLANRVDENMSDLRRIKFIKKGLLPRYFEQVNVIDITTLESLYNLFVRIEENEERARKARILRRLEQEELTFNVV